MAHPLKMFGKLAKQTDECMLEQLLVPIDEWTRVSRQLALSTENWFTADYDPKWNQTCSTSSGPSKGSSVKYTTAALPPTRVRPP